MTLEHYADRPSSRITRKPNQVQICSNNLFILRYFPDMSEPETLVYDFLSSKFTILSEFDTEQRR